MERRESVGEGEERGCGGGKGERGGGEKKKGEWRMEEKEGGQWLLPSCVWEGDWVEGWEEEKGVNGSPVSIIQHKVALTIKLPTPSYLPLHIITMVIFEDRISLLV